MQRALHALQHARRLLQAQAAYVATDAAQLKHLTAEEGTEALALVAIVGRPNVGKSALYNRLVRRKEALVHNTPEGHVTRDYKEGSAQLADLAFRAVDTSGLEPFSAAGSIQARATALTALVLHRAQVALLLLDAREGVTAQDEALVQWLRGASKAAIVLAANKAEAGGKGIVTDVSAALSDATRLGLGEAVAISAETGDGMADLYAALQPHVDAHAAQGAGQAGQQADADAPLDGLAAHAAEEVAVPGRQEAPAERGALKLAIMGLPNVGKSTLANRLLGRERSLTGPEPGLTRDAVEDAFCWQGRAVQLVDTAGWMRRTRLHLYDDSGGGVAALTLQQGRLRMHMAAAVVLVVDLAAAAGAEGGPALTRREAALAHSVVQEGRALMVVANKADLLPTEERRQALDALRASIEAKLPDVAGLPVLATSAAEGTGIQALMPAIVETHRKWATRRPTAKLNAWTREVIARYQQTGATGRDLARVRYLTQVKARPPTFAAFVGGTVVLPDNSRRLLARLLREEHGFTGVPVRVEVRYRKAQGGKVAAATRKQRGTLQV